MITTNRGGRDLLVHFRSGIVERPTLSDIRGPCPTVVESTATTPDPRPLPMHRGHGSNAHSLDCLHVESTAVAPEVAGVNLVAMGIPAAVMTLACGRGLMLVRNNAERREEMVSG